MELFEALIKAFFLTAQIIGTICIFRSIKSSFRPPGERKPTYSEQQIVEMLMFCYTMKAAEADGIDPGTIKQHDLVRIARQHGITEGLVRQDLAIHSGRVN